MQLLLLSNSTNYGESYMDWCKNYIADFVKDCKSEIVFVPFAAVGFSYDDYTAKVNEALTSVDVSVKGIHEYESPIEAVHNASAIFVGGGNTFALLKKMYELGLVEAIAEKANAGTPYCGWSAGSNVAGKTICTTNDMPVVEPMSFNALNLVSYQINPHYTDKTIPNHGGETRMQRLQEFIAANLNENVVCLPEASFVRVNGSKAWYESDNEASGFVLNAEGETKIDHKSEISL